MTNLKRIPLGEGQVILNSSSISSWVSQLTNFDLWHGRDWSTWTNMYRYCWWDLKIRNYRFPQPIRVTSPEELVRSVARPYLFDEGGGNFSGSISFKLSLEVDEDDMFPQLRVCRNSLVASARGRHRYNRHSSISSGISGAFNSPSYYLNFWGQTGQLFVQHYTSVLPATNNDGVVWWPLNIETKENWIKIGNPVELLGPNRTACWDTVGLAYTTPAPGGSWTAQQPFLWTESYKNQLLVTENIAGPAQNLRALDGPTALVYPLTQGTNVAFLVHAHSFDSFVTDYIDSDHQLVMKVKYRGNKHSYYTTLTSISDDDDFLGNKKSQFSFFPVGGGSPLYKSPKKSTIDSNNTPTKIQICRRNIHTAVHSPWVTLATLKRRLPNAPMRLDPTFRRQ